MAIFDGHARARRGRLGVAALSIALIIGLTTACSSTGGRDVALIVGRPGHVTGAVIVQTSGEAELQVRFTSGTGKAIEVQAQPITLRYLPPVTVTDLGGASPWTTVAATLGGTGRFPVPLMSALRMTAESGGALTLEVEVRALVNGAVVATNPFIDPFNENCQHVQAHADLTAVPELTGGALGYCTIPGVTMDADQLTGTYFSNGDVSGATILPGTMTRTNFQGARVNGATFAGVTVDPTSTFTDADLSEANFDHADLTGVSLVNTKLDGTKLATATLTNVIGRAVRGTPLLPPGWLLRHGVLVHATANLSGATFTGDDLKGLPLAGVDLNHANLTGADLTGTDLTGADLRDAVLTSANVSGTKLTGAQLAGAHGTSITGTPASIPAGFGFVAGTLVGPGISLDSAHLAGADLHGLDLTGASLVGADLTDANLSGANLTGANLSQATVTGTVLTGATLTGLRTGQTAGAPIGLPAAWRAVSGVLIGPTAKLETSLLGADLSGMDLHGLECFCDLSGGSLAGANLTNAKLSYLRAVNLTNANLTGATVAGDFDGATFTGVDLANTTFDAFEAHGIVGTPAGLAAGTAVINATIVGPDTRLDDVDLHGQDLRAIDFSRVKAFGNVFDLTGADLRGVSFSHAQLVNTKFVNARIDGTDLRTLDEAVGVDFTGATGTPRYDPAMAWSSVTCPDGTPGTGGGTAWTCQGHPWP